MSTDTTKNMINLNDSISICSSLNIKLLSHYVTQDTSILLFDNNITDSNILFEFHKNKQIDKLIIITNSKYKSSKERLFACNKISKSVLKHVKKNLLIVINLDNSYSNSKSIIKNLITLKNLSEELNIQLGIMSKDSNFLGFIEPNNSIYFSDLINSLKAICILDKQKQYEFIYDTVCDYLDMEFKNNNFCKFKDDACIGNKNGQTSYSDMGCCHSFQHSKFWSPTFIENMKLCSYLDCKTCSIKCISCKMFTCKYLQDKGIKFNHKNILLLDCFFNKKQYLVLESNFFKTKNEIVEKLMEKDNNLYIWYYLKRKYAI